jgi:hypothetical protein
MAASQNNVKVKRSWGGQASDAMAAVVAGLNRVRRGTVALNLPSIDGGAVGSVDVAIADAKAGDFVSVQPAATLDAGLIPRRATVKQDGTVTIEVQNTTAAPIDAAAANWEYLVVGTSTLTPV